MIQTLSDAERYLAQFIEKTSKVTGKNVTVERMWPLLKLAGNPERKLQAIHIAGTSGKTSTAYYCSELLALSGKKVGLTVSPHVEKITERLQIDGSPISDDEFCDLLRKFIVVLGDDFDASYFEFMIVFVLWSFVQLGVDYAVVETGLGGLHDGTNVFRQENKVCVITDIGYDHQHILGSTLSEIAAQKAGIIQNENAVFMYEQAQPIMEQINKRIKSQNATLTVIKEKSVPGDLPLYQKRNWQLANEVFKFINKRDGLLKIDDNMLQNTMVSVPGRMQSVLIDKTTFVLDGAHNVQKMTALVDSFVEKFGSTKVPCILAMKEDKDYLECIPVLKKIVSRIYACEFQSQQDMPVRSVKAQLLTNSCLENGIPSEAFLTMAEAVDCAKKENEPVIVITGSFYSLRDALRAIKS